MKSRSGLVLINVLSVLVLAAGIITVPLCLLLAAKPFAQKGTVPRSSQSSRAEPALQGWDGGFANFLFCGLDDTNSLTDVILLVSFNNQTGHINILQIPRDTYAGRDIPSHKYNAVYNHHAKGVSGMENLKARVEKDFGVHIDDYAAVTTSGLRAIVDAAGGVDMDVPIDMNYDDPVQNLHIHLSKGMQHLSGAQAEEFVRYRKGWAEGDMGRLKAQRAFLAAFAQKLSGMSTLSLTTRLGPAMLPPRFMTDMTTMQIIRFGLAAKKVNFSDVSVYTMPGEYLRVNGASMYTIHKKELLELLNKAFVPEGTTLSISSLDIPQLQGSGDDSYAGTSQDFGSLIHSATAPPAVKSAQ